MSRNDPAVVRIVAIPAKAMETDPDAARRTEDEGAMIDPVSLLYNRRRLNVVLAQELSRATLGNIDLSLLLIDIDQFKAVNDAHGHAAGDGILHELGRFLRGALRAYDVICRFGGDEIVVVVPGASSDVAGSLAERLRAGVASLVFIGGTTSIRDLTISVGVAAFGARTRTSEQLLGAAEAALRAAKRARGNCVRIHDTV